MLEFFFNFQLWRIYQWKKFCKSRIIDRKNVINIPVCELKALALWIFLSFTSFWRNSDAYTIYQLLLHMVFTARNWFAMQGPVAIMLSSWNVIFIWETRYWTRAIKRFALFDLLKSLYSDTKIFSKYISSLHSESIARCKHQYAGEAGILLHIFGKFMILKLKLSRLPSGALYICDIRSMVSQKFL
jgi:hypothetical protein